MIHEVKDARNLLSVTSYCKTSLKSNKKFSYNDFLARLEKLHAKKIEIISYTGLSNPLKYKCPECGKEKIINPARASLYKHSLCDECDGTEKNIIQKKINAIFEHNTEYQLLTYRGATHKATIKCNNCGGIYDRYPANIIQCPNTCPFCNSGADKQKLTIAEIQARVDTAFGVNRYTVLNYRGQLSKDSTIRCNDCGLIFNAQVSTFLAYTRGCPKCKRFKSKGEQLVERYLLDNNIKFEAQKRFKDCNNNLSSFDFCVITNQQQHVLIEVNGIQHYKENSFFEGLQTIQRRDSLKYNYCKSKGYTLIIIPYTNLTYEKIDTYLSFLKGSTTIS